MKRAYFVTAIDGEQRVINRCEASFNCHAWLE